jgi:uncharacterized membrane protein YccC
MSGADRIAARSPSSFLDLSKRSVGFAVRIWLAAVLSLLGSFWLQLQSPSSAMITVMILAEPTRGQVLEKAVYRLVATAIGIVVSIVMVGALSQSRELLLAAFAMWLGLCVYACGLLDGYRAYAAVLSGYTVAFVAIQPIDDPSHVFELAMERGAAIVVGVLSLTLVNTLLLAPDRYPQLSAQLAALHRRVRTLAQAAIRGEAVDALVVATLLQQIVALRPDISSLATEESGGSKRSAAARSAMVALVTEVHALRAVAAASETLDPTLRERFAATLDTGGGTTPRIPREGSAGRDTSVWALEELLRCNAEVCAHLSQLKAGKSPSRPWRAPLYRSQRIAIENGVRAGACLAVAAVLLAATGWPSISFALSLIGVVIGLGATTPAPRAFTFLGFIGAPIAIALTGILLFVVLNGSSDFPVLAVGLAPFLIGAAILAAQPKPLLAGLGKVNLIFISAILAASNPQTYNPQAFLFTSLFVCIATGLLLATQYLILPVSDEQRRRWLLASAQDDLSRLLGSANHKDAPEEATFRDATRVGRISAAGPADREAVTQALACFDQAAAIRFGAAELAGLNDRPSSGCTERAREALVTREPFRIRAAATEISARNPNDRQAGVASAALLVAAAVIEQAVSAARAQNQGSMP